MIEQALPNITELIDKLIIENGMNYEQASKIACDTYNKIRYEQQKKWEDDNNSRFVFI